MAYSYGIPDGTYVGKPTTASCYEKDGKLILDVKFAVKDPKTGGWFVKENGYEWEANKRHWLTSADGAFHLATINGIKEWAKGWNPQSFADFYWFQQPDAQGVPFGNLRACGEVELNFQTDQQGNQQLWVHDPNRPKGTGRKAYVPDGAQADASVLAAKWGAKAKALFAATPKKVGTGAAAPAAPAAAPAAPAAAPATAPATAPAPVAAPAAPAAPARPAAAPVRPAAAPAAPSAKPWADFPQTADGAFAYFCSRLNGGYESAKHDDKWFEIYDSAAAGKDPDEFTPEDVQRLFKAVAEAAI